MKLKYNNNNSSGIHKGHERLIVIIFLIEGYVNNFMHTFFYFVEPYIFFVQNSAIWQM